MELSLATHTVAGHVVLEVGGEVDVYTAPRLRERLVEVIEGGSRQVVVDLGRVDFLDSTGLRCLVTADERARESGRRVVIVRGPEPVQRVFTITRLEERLEMVDDASAVS